MADDWDAVAKAIVSRLRTKRMSQRKLAEVSTVSGAIIGELVKNSVQRHRTGSVLERLSMALGWEAGHLSAVAAGIVPSADATTPSTTEAHSPESRVSVQDQLDQMVNQLNHVQADVTTMHADLAADLAKVKTRLDMVLDIVFPNRPAPDTDA